MRAILILAVTLFVSTGCHAVRATGESVEAVGEGTGHAISGTGRAVSREATELHDELID